MLTGAPTVELTWAPTAVLTGLPTAVLTTEQPQERPASFDGRAPEPAVRP